ncbi:cytochrome P450 [Dinoroseobacter shibae DFL 12 = DSM 16493]|jgi:cytochrome P450|uniref:Cytochrome P450 n=1 Tax=Dinoroseobacter shibae (strain DSM 16493 / NCIMB 14021 / DFL 12) TaxID=398580 RepID=A8LI81_DINSH|nr:cytochrome P450 [Dinoroseobacter shibae]ABV92935.1 cytochrome P450 [Dinoroseobacter shibae DFL 12 = DSM 16493]URF47871.1 cytochrome P450 [Dinoroseobacter shibae]URF52180.1 cytochrome P450 [Dinoroseobacter shibae]
MGAGLPRVTQDPTDAAFVQNPYPVYDRMRALGDLVWWDAYAMPVTPTYAATGAILKDRRFGREPLSPPPVPDHLRDFYAVEAHSMLELEPPRHTRLRGLVTRAFTSARIAALAPGIEALCHALIDAFPDTPFDLLPAYCTQVPVRIIARLLGVPEDTAPQLLAWSNAMVGMYQAGRSRAMEEAANTAAHDFRAWLLDLIDARRASPADDLLSALIAAQAEDGKLTRDELVTTVILLLNAGHEATVHTLGNGVKTLLETGLRQITPATVEEVLRFDPPLHLFTRIARQEVEVFGHRFAPGDTVGCLLAAAGRDPGFAPDPHRFDPTRPTKPPHMAFGAGLHFCVGAPLARLEIEIALRVLFARCPGLRLAGAPVYAPIYHFHGLQALRVSR